MTKPVNMVAGENIPYIDEAFSSLGKLTFLPGRSITAADLKDTNILLIRSITMVGEDLLHDTPVEFVGSASAGVDHIDQSYLQSRNIAFASAGGSNANSVAEYVIAALLLLGKRHGLTLKGKTVGIVGVGNIGKSVKTKVEALGMQPVLNDPFLAETGEIEHSSLEETLGCDIVTLHTPFTIGGPHPTFHLLNEQTFKWINPAAIFINSARGEVVDTHALLDIIARKRIGPTVIDVWEGEPDINWDLFQAVTIGTPHIAGHSLDGKANGTFMIYSALCKHLRVSPTWDPEHTLPAPLVPSIHIEVSQIPDEEIIGEIVAKVYDLAVDHRRMQELLTAAPNYRPTLFDALRKNYPVRREFHRTQLILPEALERLFPIFEGLGFTSITMEP
ncbi:MAG: 4-phosphoerythronate dehydrogenase [Nitrospirales bacterium]